METKDLIVSSFMTKYPLAKYAHYQQVDNTLWAVSFVFEHDDHLAFFDANGNWLETKEYMFIEDMPKPVVHNFKDHFNEICLKKSFHLNTPEGELFEFFLISGHGLSKIVYDHKGGFLREVFL